MGYDENNLLDFTPELRKEAIAIASKYVRGPMYTPTSRVMPNGTQGTWVSPGYGGGSNWNGQSGGVGFTGAWSVNNTANSAVNSGSLSYSSGSNALLQSGNSVNLTLEASSATRPVIRTEES